MNELSRYNNYYNDGWYRYIVLIIIFNCVVPVTYQHYAAFGIVNNVYSVHRNYQSVIDSVIKYFEKVIK